MPTFINIHEDLTGEFDKGAGYLADMQWHLEATGGYAYFVEHVNWTDGAIESVILTPGVFIDSNLHREFHYRFIPVPNPLVLLNPPLDSPIEWRLWNTFPSPDEALAATITGSNVITSTFVATTAILDFEWLELAIQVAPGEPQIDAELFGDMTQGDFILDIIGLVVLDINDFPEDGVTEKWKWNTRVMVAWDSTEQRVQYAPYPIRSLEAEYILDEVGIVDRQYRIYQSALSTMTVPYFHLQTRLTAPSALASNRLYFNPAYTNIKSGDTIAVIDEQFSFPIRYLTAETLFADGCSINNSLAFPLQTGYVICPAYPLFLNKPQIQMKQVTGSLRINGEVSNRNRPVSRDGNPAVLSIFKGLPVLDFKTQANQSLGYELLFEDEATNFGKRERSIVWEAPKVLRSASFSTKMAGPMPDYDYATKFFDTIGGRLKPFFISSQLEELVLDSNPPSGSSQIEIQGITYSTVYFPNEVYKQLEIEYLDGTYEWFDVNTAESQPGGTDLLSLTTALPNDVNTNTITRISFLLRVRLATDEITVEYQNNRARFVLTVLGTNQ